MLFTFFEQTLHKAKYWLFVFLTDGKNLKSTKLIRMFGSIQRIKRKGFNLQWSYGIEGKDIIFTIIAIPVGSID